MVQGKPLACNDLGRRAPSRATLAHSIVNNFMRLCHIVSLQMPICVVYYSMLNTESIYKVTLVDGPTTAIIPIKAYDASHAVRIASNMGLGLVVKVDFDCKDNFEKV